MLEIPIPFLDPWWYLEGSYKIGSVCPSVLPSVCLPILLSFRPSVSGHFFKIVSLTFSKFWHGTRDPYKVVRDSWIFQENFFCPKNWENGLKMTQKQVFFKFIGKFSL